MRRTFVARLLLSMVVIAIGSSVIHADTGPNIIFHLKSGTKLILPLDDKPVISFDNGVISIGNEQYAITDVSKYTVSGTQAGAENVIAEGITINGDNITLRNVLNANSVHIYTAAGIECDCSKDVYSDRVVVNLSGLNGGYYILSIGSDNIKFSKK